MSNFIQSKIFSSHPEVIHGHATRELGADYEKIAKELEVDLSQIFSLKQTHSNISLSLDGRATEGSPCGRLGRGCEREKIEGDALITNQPGQVIGIRTADCVPLLAYDPQKKIVAAIHAGWRGLISGVIENSLTQLKNLGASADHLKVAIGPAICEKCFEVGPEVVQEFSKKFGNQLKIKKGNGDKSYLSLKEGCRLVLKAHHVPDKNIEVLPYCTQCDSQLFYSYRRGDRNQRMFSFIGLLDH